MGDLSITGNTYPVRSQLKSLGCRWSPGRQCWMAPNEEIAQQARELVPAGSGRTRGTFRPKVCKTCGCKINYGVYCGKCEYA